MSMSQWVEHLGDKRKLTLRDAYASSNEGADAKGYKSNDEGSLLEEVLRMRNRQEAGLETNTSNEGNDAK